MWSENARMLGMRIRQGMDGSVLEHGVEGSRLSPASQGHAGEKVFPQGDAQYGQCLEAISRLPAVLRSAMILSYLEGFSTAGIARLAGVEPREIESLLVRGREMMQEEFIAYLKSYDDAHEGADLTVGPVGTSGPIGGPSSVGSARQ